MESADRVFGWIAVQRGFIASDRMEQAHGARTLEPGALPFADWLVVRGWLTREQRDEVVRSLQRASSAHTVVDTPAATEGAATDPTRPHTGEPAPGPLTVGRLGKYDLLEEIGRGGMGVVYRALDSELRREVALKTVLLGDAVRKESVDRLLREARTAAGLEHPGIVPIHDMGVIDGVPYFAMTFVRGVPLDRLLREGALVRLRDRARMVRDVARAVGHAHARKIIHRDLKPSNLLVDDGGRVLVMDFGLAKRLDEGMKITATGQMIGTPHYMSPEQIEGDAERIGPASDVYSLGAVLYEVLTGRPPYDGSSVAEIVGKALQGDPAPPRRRDRRIHPDLETICLKALEKEPARRYPDAGEMAEDLDRYLKGEAIEARPIGWWGRIGRRLARQKVLTGFAGAALLAGLWAGVSALEKLELHGKVREDLREKAGLYLDATLMLRREGLSTRRAREQYLPRLLAAVEEADRLDPGRAEPHYHLGGMYRALMRFDLALREQDTALGRDPAFAPALYEHAVLTAQLHGRRLAWLRERALQRLGARLAGAGASSTQTLELPGDAALEQADAEAQGMRARLLADLAALARPCGTQLPPERLACAQGLALAYGPAGAAELAEARRLLVGAIDADSSLEEAYDGLARVELAGGKWDEAAAVFEQGLDRDKGYVPFWLGRASARSTGGMLALNRGGDPRTLLAGALADYARALELAPEAAEGWLGRGAAGLAWGLYKAGRGEDPAPLYGGAAADFAKAAEIAPGTAAAWTGRGLVRANWGWSVAGTGGDPEEHYQAAEDDFGAAIACDGADGRAWRFRGQVRTNRGWHRMLHGRDAAGPLRDAVQDLARAIQLNPADFETWRQRGLAWAHWGSDRAGRGEAPDEPYALALADLEKAIALNPADAESWMWRGTVNHDWAVYASAVGARGASRLAEAEGAFSRAIERNPALAEAWMRRGKARGDLALDALAGGGEPDPVFRLAVTDLDQALELNPALARALLWRAQVRMSAAPLRLVRGEDARSLFEETAADLDKAVEMQPDLAEAWGTRGRLRLLFGHHQRAQADAASALFAGALEDLGQAVTLNPRLAAAYTSRGLLHAELGGWREAEEDLERARQINPVPPADDRALGARAHHLLAAGMSAAAPDDAFLHLDRALDLGWDASELATDPALASLRGDPRWENLVARGRE